MKKELDDYLYELTMNLKEGSEERFSAYKIAESLQLNRSTISSYLNQAFREGELVKIKSYPVLFLHKKALEDASIETVKLEYDSLEELFAQDQGT
ncbi:MAG: transcription antiterminator BglG, partial [Enterococcus hulanensis]